MTPLFQRPIILTGHTAAIYALTPWRGGLLSGGGDGQLVWWQPGLSGDGKVIAKLEDRIFCILPLTGIFEGKIVLGTLTGDLYWIDADQHSPPRRWIWHKDGLFGLQQIGDQVLAVGGEGSISRWSATNGEFVEARQLDSVRLRSIVWLSQNQRLLIGTAAGDLLFVEPDSLVVTHTQVRAHDATVFGLALGDEHLFSAGRDGAIRVWKNEPPYTQCAFVPAHQATVNAVAIDPNQSLLASVGRDREVRVWEVLSSATSLEQATAPVQLVLAKALKAGRDGGHSASVNACCWLKEGLATAGDDRTIRIWPFVKKSEQN